MAYSDITDEVRNVSTVERVIALVHEVQEDAELDSEDQRVVDLLEGGSLVEIRHAIEDNDGPISTVIPGLTNAAKLKPYVQNVILQYEGLDIKSKAIGELVDHLRKRFN